MIGLVLVSHSAPLADGARELAAQVAGADLRIGVAAGLDLPDRPLGTDAALVARVIDEVWSEDGVLVLMDLGSAVLSAEMALELLPEERRRRARERHRKVLVIGAQKFGKRKRFLAPLLIYIR